MDYKLKTGATLHVDFATFRDANALKKALLPTLKGLMLNNDADISALLAPIIDTVISDDVEDAIFRCFEKCVYYPKGKESLNQAPPMKIDSSLFDDPTYAIQARKDYHEICLYVIKENVECFFETILSWLKEKNLLKNLPFQQSTSTPNS